MLKRLLSLSLSVLFLMAVAAHAQPAAKRATSFELPINSVGKKDAPITIEVFSDFQCPHCREFYDKTLTRVIDDYCSSGKVYLVHHDFPLPQHPYARMASVWAVAAGSIGKYEPVTAALFEKQDVWGQDGRIEPILAPVLGPTDLARVRKIVQDHQTDIDNGIEKDIFLAHSLNVSQTPTFRITHRGQVALLNAGGVPYVVLRKYIDDLLAK